MIEIADVILDQLVRQYGCAWAALLEERGSERREVARAGERTAGRDGAVLEVHGEVTLIVEFAFTAEATAEQRSEASIVATSLVSGVASLQAYRATESSGTGTILIVDDDIGVRTIVRHVLQREGFAVIEAPNGVIAHARALEFRPDLVIIDWMMPELDGHDAAIRFKADPFTAAIPIVMLTSRAKAEDKIAALAAGVQDFLTKPFAPATLTAAVGQQLRWRRLLADDADPAAVAAAPQPRRLPSAQAQHLAHFVEVAEVAEERRAFDDAAEAYAHAADLAMTAATPDIANKFRRLSGKMYLLLAESGTEPETIQLGYSKAARAFLAAGNISSASTAYQSAKEAVGPGP
jgi:DNA-binding response OmpR family regulator